MKKKMISAFALILALSAAVRAQEAPPLPLPRDGKERRPPPEQRGNVDESTN